jgi:hypothetical protein
MEILDVVEKVAIETWSRRRNLMALGYASCSQYREGYEGRLDPEDILEMAMLVTTSGRGQL